MLTRIDRRRATDEVYDAIRQSILSHLFLPGERLQVEEIAQKLGVSMTPVRHAIHRLAAEGLIEILPRSGTFVAKLSARDVEETCEIRCALECLAGELAVSRIGAGELAEFREILNALALPVLAEEDRKRHEHDNFRFHELLIRCSGNQRLMEMYESLQAHLQIARVHRAGENWAVRLPGEQAEHEEIFAALEQRDASRLTAALRAHIQRAKTSLTAALQGGAG